MKLLPAAAVLLCISASTIAHAKDCDELKTEIAKKLEAKGVKTYELEIVAKDKDAKGKVVGTCGGGTMKIVYQRTAMSSENPPAEASKPQ